jgi:ribonuclease R
MEEKILDIIVNHNKALTYDEIIAGLDEKEIPIASEVLNKLVRELKIRITNKGKYAKFDDKMQKVGIFVANRRGFGFVTVEGEDKDYFVPQVNVNGAVNGDEVVIRVTDEIKREAAVLQINKRNLDNMLVGEFYVKDEKNFIKLDDDKLNIIIEIPDGDTMGAVTGHKVIVKINNKIEKTNYYQGKIIRILGHKDDPGVDILSIAAKFKINDVFPDAVLEELKSIPSEVSREELKGRKDLTGETIFTIDGDDTKDIDDAVSIKKNADGNYTLGVHIADVSHYVKEHTALGDEAFNRGTSSYLANTVIPMLPHQLSNGICSLNPNEIRLAISCVMEIDATGKIVDSDIFPSYIKSRKQMTYKNVNMILEKNIIPEGYEDFADDLRLMAELSKIIRKNKVEKGYIEFDIDEAKIITDENGKAIDIKKRERGTGENLIEDFMIAANETIASTISYMDLPFIYRVHGLPDQDKIKNFLHFVGVLGYKVNANIKNITPKTIQNILKQLEDSKEYPILSSMLLRSMQKAVYDSVNIGHFGLASKFYTHFTSPIRRFPDLTVHRLVRTYLFESKIDNTTIDYFNQSLPIVAKQSSDRERAADECERAVEDMKMAEYMESHIGEVYKGVIDTVTNYGLYVELPNLVEGLIKMDDLNDDYYFYNEETYSLIGKHSKKRFMLGDEVEIIVESVVKEKGLINFKLNKKGDNNGDKQPESEVQLSSN